MRAVGRLVKVRQLRIEIGAAKKRIGDLFATNVRGSPPTEPAWGQYLDDRSCQVGLFGTCAAIEVLARQGGKSAELAEAASASLPDLDNSNNPSGSEVFDRALQKGDLGVTYKLCARAEAVSPTEASVKAPQPIFDALAAGASEGEGWADYSDEGSLSSYASVTNVAATGSALYSLRRYANFAADYQAKQQWLAQRCKEVARAPTYELSLVLLALECVNSSSDEVNRQIGRLRDELGHRCRQRRSGGTNFTHESHEYLAPELPTDSKQGDGELIDELPQATVPRVVAELGYRYMFYLPDVLASFALLGGQRRLPFRVRRDIYRTVRACCDAISENGGVVGTGRLFASSVDQLWVYRLLEAYEAVQERRIRPLRTSLLVSGGIAIVAVPTALIWLSNWKTFLFSLVVEITLLVLAKEASEL